MDREQLDKAFNDVMNKNKVNFMHLCFFIFDLNPYPNAKDYSLNFPQPDWWILKIIAWTWVKFIQFLGWLILFNFLTFTKIVILLVRYVVRTAMMEGEEHNTKLNILIENILGLLFVFASSAFYFQIIIPTQSSYISIIVDNVNILALDVIERASNFSYHEHLDLIKHLVIN